MIVVDPIVPTEHESGSINPLNLVGIDSDMGVDDATVVVSIVPAQLGKDTNDGRYRSDRGQQLVLDILLMSAELPCADHHLGKVRRLISTMERAVLGKDAAIWSLITPVPHNNVLKWREDLARFRSVVRGMLDRIKAEHGGARPLHVFPIMPVAAAVELGCVWMLKDRPRACHVGRVPGAWWLSRGSAGRRLTTRADLFVATAAIHCLRCERFSPCR